MDTDFPHNNSQGIFLLYIIIKKLTNWEKNERRWIIYSTDLDRVFCFCCKLFNFFSNTSKITSKDSRDRRNFSAKLKIHKTTNKYIINMRSLINLKMRLLKNKIINKNVQEQINRDREYWKKKYY